MCRVILLTMSYLWLAVCSNFAYANSYSSLKVYNIAVEADDITTRALFNAASKHFNFIVKYVTYPSFDAILKAIETGNADFAANVTFTEERAKLFEISRPTNIEYTYLFSKKRTRLNEIKIVGIPEGTIYGSLIHEYYPELLQVSYLGHDAAVALLRSNRVDGVVDAINQLKPMVMKGFEAEILNDQIPIKPVSIVAPTGRHTDLLEQIQKYAHSEAVQKILSAAIKEYQFTIREQSLRQTVKKSGLDLNRTYKVKSENLDEYTMYKEDGSVEGISVDVVSQACDILSIKCEIISKKDETWESMYSDLLENRIDILSPMIISQTRKPYMYFSEPFYFPEVVLIKRENYKNNVYGNISELITEKIGVIKNDFYDNLLTRMLPNKVLYRYTNQDDKVEALLENKIDYMVLSRVNYNHLLLTSEKLLPIEEETLIGNFYSPQVAVAFAMNETGKRLAPLFSEAIQMLNLPKIVNKYNIIPDWRATLLAEKKFNRYRLWFLFLLLTLVGVVAYYLHVQSTTDNLTRLKNRRALYRKYARGIPAWHTVVYLDVNKFKSINDTLGHAVGDNVLKVLTDRINLYWKGSAYRMGGDEFILTSDDRDDNVLNSIANLEYFVFVDSQRKLKFSVTTAIGISQRRNKHMTLEEVLLHTDAEMYKAKHRSRELPPSEMETSEEFTDSDSLVFLGN